MYKKIEMNVIIILLLAILFNVVGTVLVKKSLNIYGPLELSFSFFTGLYKIFISPAFLSGALLYSFSFFLWIYSLSNIDLSFAYPFLSLSYVFILLSSYLFLGEDVSIQRWIGVLVICFGVFLISRT